VRAQAQVEGARHEPGPTTLTLGVVDDHCVVLPDRGQAGALIEVVLHVVEGEHERDNNDPARAREYLVWLADTFGKDFTTRSWLTVQRIVRKLEG
jgi:hypothetical protein